MCLKEYFSWDLVIAIRKMDFIPINKNERLKCLPEWLSLETETNVTYRRLQPCSTASVCVHAHTWDSALAYTVKDVWVGLFLACEQFLIISGEAQWLVDLFGNFFIF